MYTISNTVERKFVNSINLSNLEIETDSGWQPVTAIHKTVPYNVWKIKTASGLSLECADTHILFDENFNEIFTKDIVENKTKIITQYGADLVTMVSKTDTEENMFDLTVDHPDHRFYTNGILSHNTVILNAISYALYGSALTNIKKPNLINNINGKQMLVTLTFEKNNTSYRIERGRSPFVLKFFVNDTEVEYDESQGDSRNTQTDINDLLDISHDMFKHIVALNTYTEPFLSMRQGDQRNIIEQLLGITLLSQKAEELKIKIKESKEEIVEETARINAISESNKRIEETIKSTRLRQRAWIKQKQESIDKLNLSLQEFQKLDIDSELEKHDQLNRWVENTKLFDSLSKEKSTYSTALMTSERTLSKVRKQLNDTVDDLCYACGQTLHDHKKEEITKSKEKELQDAETYHQSLIDKIKCIDEKINNLDHTVSKPITFYDSLKEVYEHQNNTKSIVDAISNKEQESDPYADQIEQLEKNAIQTVDWTKINELSKYQEHQEFLHKLLTNKDSFIRKKIIDQNLAYLNKRLGYYLNELGLPHQVKFQSDLSVEITQLGKDLDFDNLSRGERNRLILGMSWAFRDVWENLYQGINLLFIDELVDSGLDTAGVENCLKILKKMSRDRKKNIYLISHKEELIGRVNNVLKVIKSNGFTTYENDTEVA